MRLWPAKTAERIEVLFVVKALGAQRNTGGEEKGMGGIFCPVRDTAIAKLILATC